MFEMIQTPPRRNQLISVDYRFQEINPAIEKLNGVSTSSLPGRKVKDAMSEIEQYWRFFEQSSQGSALIDESGCVAEWNAALEQITGISRAQALGKPFSEIQVLLTPPQYQTPALVESQKNTIEAVLNTGESPLFNRVIETRYQRTDGEIRFVQQSIFPIQTQKGFRLGLLSQDITERKQNEAIIRLRLELLEYADSHSLAELMQKALDEIGSLIDSPIGFYHFVETDQRTLVLQAWSTRTQQVFCQAEGKGAHYSIDQAGVWVDCIKQRKPVIHNDYASLPHRKGMPPGHAQVIRELIVPVFREDRVVAILGVGNKPVDYGARDIELVAYVADVTWEIIQRKRSDEILRQLLREKEILLKELQHRTKNSLMVVSNLLDLEMSNLPDERSRAIFANAQDRIRSMAAIYEQLYREDSMEQINLSVYIRRLAHELAKSYLPTDGQIKIETHLAEINLDSKRALPLGIILNELITNAIKYAFLPGMAGKIHIALERHRGKITLIVSDNGIGINPEAQPKADSGLGLRLVEILTLQLQGHFTIEGAGGTTAQLTFAESPLQSLTAAS